MEIHSLIIITLLYKNMLCGRCNQCSTCQGITDNSIYRVFTEIHEKLDGNFHLISCGSYAEECPLPPMFVEDNSSGGNKTHRSDFDFMVYDSKCSFPVGLDHEKERGIKAEVETRHTKPGYLRLRSLDGQYVRNVKTDYCLEQGKLLLNKIQSLRFLQHEPPNIYSDCNDNCDVVFYFPCNVWPNQAKEWIVRKRQSKWPTKDTVDMIVTTGCAVVSKSHPSSMRTDLEFRYSFSFAEKTLFSKLTLEQKKCFIAFKSVIKQTIKKLEISYESKSKIKTYHLKTIFLWACETIDVEDWEFVHGWANCFLFLVDQLLICMEKRSLPSYFIPDCDLLAEIDDNLELFKILKDEIIRIRLTPIETAAQILDSLVSEHLIHPRTLVTVIVSMLFISKEYDCCSHVPANMLSHARGTAHGFGRNQQIRFQLYSDSDRIHIKEYMFFKNVFKNCRKFAKNELPLDMFKKTLCSVLEPYAEWCKDHDSALLHENMTSIDLIFLN